MRKGNSGPVTDRLQIEMNSLYEYLGKLSKDDKKIDEACGHNMRQLHEQWMERKIGSSREKISPSTRRKTYNEVLASLVHYSLHGRLDPVEVCKLSLCNMNCLYVT